jgi:signal transduction histidine kinase
MEAPTTTQAGVGSTMSATKIDQLLRSCLETGADALWREALPWIADLHNAHAARALLQLPSSVSYRHGETSSEIRQAIDVWEDSLLSLVDWMPPGSGSLMAAPPIPPVSRHSQLPILHVPIRKGSGVVGGLSLVFASNRAAETCNLLSVEALVHSIARLAALATERHQVQRHLTRLNLLHEVSRVLNTSLEIDTVLEFTTSLAANSLGTDSARIRLTQQGSQELVLAMAQGSLASPSLQEQALNSNSSISQWVARSGQPLVVTSAQSNPRHPSPPHQPAIPESRNLICVPLQVKGTTVGVLEVLSVGMDSQFDEEDLDWLVILASQAAIAIDNARLYESLQDERDRIILAEEEVRFRLARNLHDGAAQLLASLMMNIEAIRRLARAGEADLEQEFDSLRELAHQANQEIRRSLFELRPLPLESRGLIGALQHYIEQQDTYPMPITVQLTEVPIMGNREAESTVFLIVQEALNNARRHATATEITLHIDGRSDHLAIEVEDNGCGFDVDEVITRYHDRASLGLLNMRERAELLEGDLAIISPRPNQTDGTLVRLTIPLERLTP